MIKFKESPVLLEKVLQSIQKVLLDKLSWLDYAFGKSYRLVDKGHDFERFTYPAVYAENGEYISVLPNDNFGNFSWFDIYDPQDVDVSVINKPKITIRGALVFWYKASDIYEDNTYLYTEEIKNEILKALTSPGIIRSVGSVAITEIYERFENIYKGYSIENIDKQFFMYPYAGIRFEFIIKTKELC